MDVIALKSIRWFIVATAFLYIVYRNRDQLDRFQLGREMALVIGAYFAYFAVRGMTEGSHEQAVANADTVISFERTLGILWEPRIQEALVGYQPIINFANWIYIWGHWPLIITVATWLYTSHPDTYKLFRNGFLFSGAIGIVIFAIFPVAPPRLADINVVDTVTLHSQSYRLLQPPGLVNEYAAMPSLHFGWNMLLGFAVVMTARSPLIKVAGALVPPLMLFAIVVTANHYIIDAVAGGALAAFGLWLATRIDILPVQQRSADAYRRN